MFGSKLNYESQFFVSGQELSGIESIDIGYNNSANITKPLGYSQGVTTVAGPTEQAVSLSRYLIYVDPILNYTGDINMSGSIHYDGASYGFESGYLNSYSVNCAVGSIPRVNADFVVYDEMRSGYNASGAVSPPAIRVPTQGSIAITADNVTNNRVVGFDYSVSCKRKPYYTIGSETIADIKLLPPLEYTAAVQLDVDNAFMESGFAFLGTGKGAKTVSVNIDDNDANDVASFTVPNASLISEQLNASSDGTLKLTLNYRGHS